MHRNGGRCDDGIARQARPETSAGRDPVSGDVNLSWIRRTRLGGDAWLSEVPLGEETEAYDVQVLSGSTVLRTTRVAAPMLLYTAAQQSADFGSPPGIDRLAASRKSRASTAAASPQNKPPLL